MNKSETKVYYLYIAISLVFIVATTNYLSLFDIIHVANQTDVISYNEIARNAPSIKNQRLHHLHQEGDMIIQEGDMIIQHVAQRFLIPYIVGSIANLLSIDFFLVFKFFTLLFIVFYIFFINLLIKNLIIQ